MMNPLIYSFFNIAITETGPKHYQTSNIIEREGAKARGIPIKTSHKQRYLVLEP